MGQKYGQHFLSDETVLADIASAVFSLQGEMGANELWEIGPGQGVLTKLVIGKFDRVKLYEIDITLEKYLKRYQSEHRDLEIVRGDILECTIEGSQDGKDETLIVGNLPYYITSPILRKFFEGEEGYEGGVFLIQKEVAEKIESGARKKSYLRWILNAYYDISLEFIVPPSAFSPPPNVDSAVISVIKSEARIHKEGFEKMKTFLDIIMGLKRKTLGKTAKIRAEKLSEAGITIPEDIYTKRLEELTREEMKKIVK